MKKRNRRALVTALAAALILTAVPVVRTNAGGGARAALEVHGQNPNALFQSMQITINTLNNDKDHDTRLEIWINKAGEREAAYLDIQGRKFDDNSVHIYDVPRKNNPMVRGEIPGSWVQLRIAPNGNDTWNFQIRVLLRFNDGTVYEKQFGPSTLDQDARQANYAL